jgi:hypothetical protein
VIKDFDFVSDSLYHVIRRGEWGYLDRFLFFLRRPFPNYPICEINVLLYFSQKSGRGKIWGLYGTGGCTI